MASIETAKYQQKVGLVSKSYKLKKEIVLNPLPVGLNRAIRCGNNTGASVCDNRGFLFI